GAVALAMIILIPSNPVLEIDLGLRRLRSELSQILATTAEAMRHHDANRASAALEHARGTQGIVDTVGTMADSVSEMARLSPFRWKQRTAVLTRTSALVDLDHAVRNTRVLSRRVAAMLRNGEPAPLGLVEALD